MPLSLHPKFRTIFTPRSIYFSVHILIFSRNILSLTLPRSGLQSECDPSLNDQETNADLPVLPAGVIASNCLHTCPGARGIAHTWPRQSSVQWMIFVEICAKQVNLPVTHGAPGACHVVIPDLTWDPEHIEMFVALYHPIPRNITIITGHQAVLYSLQSNIWWAFFSSLLIDDLWSVVT